MVSLIRLGEMNLMHLIQIIMSSVLHYSEMRNLIYLAALYLRKISTVEQAEHGIKNTDTLTRS